MRRFPLLLASIALAAGCGGSGGESGANTTTAPPPTTTESGSTTVPPPPPSVTLHPPAGKLKVTLTAPTHRPRVNEPWRYVVRIRDSKGKPVRARVYLKVLFQGSEVGSIGVHLVTGVWRETIQWPPESRGHPLVFEATVIASGKTKRILYPVRVR